MSDAARSALAPCRAPVIRAEWDLPPLHCCDTLLVSSMPPPTLCQKVPYRAANGRESISPPLPRRTHHPASFKVASSVDFFIVGDAVNRKVGDLQSVTGLMITGGHGVSSQGPESNRGKCLFSGSGAVEGLLCVTRVLAVLYVCPLILLARRLVSWPQRWNLTCSCQLRF